MSGTLFIVATPIGNLEDLTPRARQTLAAVDLIAAEDTRRTGRLLSNIGVETPQIALHEHNEIRVTPKIISALLAGDDIALVSDAGTPLISDPGFRLVKSAHENAIAVSPIPGPSALTAALSVAGLPTARFAFEGFLPPKKAARQRALSRLETETRTLVFFESVHRIQASLEDLARVFGEAREAFLGRELTKLHEQCVFGTLGSLSERLNAQDVVGKGEFVIVVRGSEPKTQRSVDIDVLTEELAAVLPAGEAAAVIARATGEKKNAVYQRLLARKIT